MAEAVRLRVGVRLCFSAHGQGQQVCTWPVLSQCAFLSATCRSAINGMVHAARRPCGLMDKALFFGTKDCRFESCQGHASRSNSVITMEDAVIFSD